MRIERRVLGAFAAGAFAISVVGFAGAGSASADAPDAQGWWWKAQAGALPAALPAPPTASADGLYVASDSTGEQAISAVRFTVPEGATTGSLTLKVSGRTLGTPVVGLCQVTGPWEAVQNGPWDKRPSIAQTGCSSGTVAADGMSVTFSTSALVSGGLLNVAIVPVKDANNNQPTFQMSLAKPDQSALSVTPAPTAEPASEPYTATEAAPATSSAAAPSASSAPLSSSAPSASSSSYTPTTSAAVVPAFNEQAAAISPETPQGAELVPSSPRRLATRPAVTTKNDNRKYQTIGIIGLALLAAIYTGLNNKASRPPRALVAFGQLDDDVVPQGGQA